MLAPNVALRVAALHRVVEDSMRRAVALDEAEVDARATIVLVRRCLSKVGGVALSLIEDCMRQGGVATGGLLREKRCLMVLIQDLAQKQSKLADDVRQELRCLAPSNPQQVELATADATRLCTGHCVAQERGGA